MTKKPELMPTGVYPGLNQKYKGEWEAWRKLAMLINAYDPNSGNHKAGCPCPGAGCEIFNAVRAWGRTIVGDDEADGMGL